MLQKFLHFVENLWTEVLEFGPLPHVARKDFKVVHDRCVVPVDYSAYVRVGVEVLGVGDVCKDAASQYEFTGLDFACDLVGVDPNDLCGVAEDGASD